MVMTRKEAPRVIRPQNLNLKSEFLYSKYLCNYQILNILLASIKFLLIIYTYISLYVNTHFEALCSIYNSFYAARNFPVCIKIPVLIYFWPVRVYT